ncbi:hypothetical protein V6N12_051937 [Hibiscus sabdariffa]|uniref:Uncharacterized protein n=1 Tax=Hibiscus sabdariffa TaxID=183260 RepID=A0ABR2GIJ9_9ROSI
MSNNHLQGTIPIEFCQLDDLVLLDLSVNSISGSVPSCLNPSQITQVHLAKNRLQGTLPNTLVTALPCLTGPIPPTFVNLKQIESLDLSYNKLSGDIPSQLVKLTFLSDFNVSFNNLSGRTPPRVAQFGTFDEYSYMRNPFLCGEPLPKCTDTGSPPQNQIHQLTMMKATV